MTANRVSPTFTEAEIQAIKAASVKLGYKPSQFLRHAALSVAQKCCPGDTTAAFSLPKKTKLSSLAMVRLSSTQRRKLERKAKEYGHSLSGVLRAAAFAYFDKATLYPKEVISQAHILTVLLRNIGTNINQIARHTNRKKNCSIFNLIEARQLVENLVEEVSRFLTFQFANDHQVDEPQNKDV